MQHGRRYENRDRRIYLTGLEVLEQEVEILRGADAAFPVGGFQALGCHDDARPFPKFFHSLSCCRRSGCDLLDILTGGA
jgi:hypothetical protein